MFKNRKPLTPERIREASLWAVILIGFGQGLADPPLTATHVVSAFGGGLGVWLAFTFTARRDRPGPR